MCGLIWLHFDWAMGNYYWTHTTAQEISSVELEKKIQKPLVSIFMSSTGEGQICGYKDGWTVIIITLWMDNYVINDSSKFNSTPNDYNKEKAPYLINYTTRQ